MPSQPRLQSANPILAVSDMDVAVDYYQRVLGFKIGWTFGEPMELVSIYRDDVEFNLSKMQAGQFGPSRVYVHIEAIDAYYAATTTAGASITVPIDDRPYGMRDFRAEDPDGNQISFGEPLTT